MVRWKMNDPYLSKMSHREMIELLNVYAAEEERRSAQANTDEDHRIRLFRAAFFREVGERIYRLWDLEH